MNKPLDLKEIEARRERPCKHGYAVFECDDCCNDLIEALLAALRETREALREAEYWIGWHPESPERVELCDLVRRKAAAALAKVRDE